MNASPHAVAAAATVAPIRARSSGRRALGVGASVAKRGYRPDLRAVSTVSRADRGNFSYGLC